MASNAEITKELMAEFGQSSPLVAQRVERAVGEVTIDILSQNDCRFERLAKVSTISLLTTSKAYKIPGDFATIKGPMIQVDSSGDFIREIEVISQQEYYRRMADADYPGLWYAMIETKMDGASGPGDYLTLNDEPDATGTYKFFYYRKPQVTDTDLIINTRAVKEGVRAMFPEYNPDAGQSLVIYERMKSGIRESPATRVTQMALMPSKATQRLNRKMHRYFRSEGH
jgi:hypothetical protein